MKGNYIIFVNNIVFKAELSIFMDVSGRLIEWYEKNKRELPWRNTKNPYFVWLSEIILQQTRVNQGLQYYLRFVENFPTIELLAGAPLDKVLKLWQGLGYYSRARNLHQTANIIVNAYNGVFPPTYKELLKLKGIGPYTAAAIASIAYEEPVAVVDGNVMRVFTRLFGITRDVRKEVTKKEVFQLSSQFINQKNASVYNQAVMEFGALKCIPVQPECATCPFSNACFACQQQKVHEIPFKSRAKKQVHRYFNYLHVQNNNQLFIVQRTKKDIWHSLYQFPLIETSKNTDPLEIIHHDNWSKWFNSADVHFSLYDEKFKHVLSHQIIHACFFKIKITDPHFKMPAGWIRIGYDELQNYAVPRLIDRFLDAYGYQFQ